MAPAGCPTTALNSDAIFPETVTSCGPRVQSCQTVPTTAPGAGPAVTRASGSHRQSSGRHFEQLTKGCPEGAVNSQVQRQRAGSGRVPAAGASVCGLGVCHLRPTACSRTWKCAEPHPCGTFTEASSRRHGQLLFPASLLRG